MLLHWPYYLIGIILATISLTAGVYYDKKLSQIDRSILAAILIGSILIFWPVMTGIAILFGVNEFLETRAKKRSKQNH